MQLVIDVVEVQAGVVAVPAEHAQRGKIVEVGVFGEVGEADLPLVAFAEGGNEQQVVRVPGGAFGAAGRRPLLEHQLAEDAAQGDNRQALGLELDEEDAPGLAGHQRAKLLDAVDLGGGLGVEAQFFRLIIEREVVEVLGVDGPIEPVAEILHQGRERLDLPEFFAMVGHGRVPSA